MRAELEAVQSALEVLGRDVFLGAVLLASDEVPPDAYYLVEVAGGDRLDDMPLSEESSAWELTVRVKAVAGTSEAAMTHLSAGRDVLVPGGVFAPLTVTGRAVVVRFARHEADYVDRDVTPPKFICLDTYTLTSVPA